MKTKIYIAAIFLIISSLSACSKEKDSVNIGKSEMKLNDLTPDEARVIIYKGTEAPYTGEYWDKKDSGTYVCRHCYAPLYRSDDKFDSHCGWPSFDDEIKGAVIRLTDADGMRTEILCAKCGAHLGHVFIGEKLTDKNTRHCVNSISMKFIPKAQEQKTNIAIFAGGCFWGTEYYFQKAKGVIATSVGYIGGNVDNPTYKQVCAGNTGHAEAIQVVFNPDATNFEELCKLFFEIHDPTQVDRQGPDIGEQYRSEIFYLDDKQKETTEKLIKILTSKGLNIATHITKAGTFWKAEDYHQDYYEKKGGRPYCHIYTKRF